MDVSLAKVGGERLGQGRRPERGPPCGLQRGPYAHERPMTLPTLYLPHGGGPCFFMDWTMGPPDTWNRMAAWLRGIDATLPEKPKALLVVSAHWEAALPTVLTSAAPPLLYDYYGFPQHTYELKWPAPGAPELGARVRHLLSDAGFDSRQDGDRGFDHGVFVPLKMAYPEAQVPTLQLSLRSGLDAAEHLAMGKALAPLRDEGVFIVGSGMSYHKMCGFNSAPAREHSLRFDAAGGRRGRRAVDTERGPHVVDPGPVGAGEPPT